MVLVLVFGLEQYDQCEVGGEGGCFFECFDEFGKCFWYLFGSYYLYCYGKGEGSVGEYFQMSYFFIVKLEFVLLFEVGEFGR